MTWIYSVAKVRKKNWTREHSISVYIWTCVLQFVFSPGWKSLFRSSPELFCSYGKSLFGYCSPGFEVLSGVFELFCYWVWNYDAPGPKFKKFVETTKKTIQFSSSLQQSRIDQGLYNYQAPSRLGKWCAITMAFPFHYRTNRKSSTWVKLGRLFADISFDSRTRCFLLAFRPDSFTFGGW